jgi:hypothetical protein
VETFVVRVFVAADADAVPFCGVVEHAGTGRAEPFQSTQDLIQIVIHELDITNESRPETRQLRLEEDS